MRFLSLVLTVLAIGLLGCSKPADSVSNALGLSPHSHPDETSQDIATDYNEVADLNLLQTNVIVSSVKNNAVSMKGTGTKSTYKITYKFNSAGYSSFKVIETRLKANGGSDCNNPDVHLYLKSKLGSKEISLVDQSIMPNTDYTLEAVADNAKCKRQDFTYDLTAWIGLPTVDAKVALICSDIQGSRMTFFTNGGFLTAFDAGNKNFLGMNFYCGEKSPEGSTGSCGGLMTAQGLTHSECTAKSATEKKSFSVDFDNPNNKVSVECKNGDSEIFADVFADCQSKVLDYNLFEKQ